MQYFKRFNENAIKAKCPLLLPANEGKAIFAGGETIQNRKKKENLPGVIIDRKLCFTEHGNRIYNKVRQKLNVSNFVSLGK